MNIPKYWEKKEVTFNIDGKEAFCNIWGYSDGNMEAAQRMIEEKIPQVEEAIRRRCFLVRSRRAVRWESSFHPRSI